jgi:putative ABC transport system substrate-binding protein
MRRRTFVLVLGAGALAWRTEAHPQGVSQSPTIGILTSGRAEPFEKVFRGALQELGYVEGRNVRFEIRRADDRVSDLPALAAELVRARVDVIVALAPPAGLAAKNATRTIPIVVAAIGDPVASGLVANLARPEGNLTGSTRMLTEMSIKHVEFLKQVAPKLSRLSVLWNPANSSHGPALKAVEAAARALSIDPRSYQVSALSDYDTVFSALLRDRANGLLFLADPVFGGHQRRIADFALTNRLPAICNFTEFAELGGLMAYAPNLYEEYRGAAVYADKILKGAKPGELPIQQPTKFELVINVKTARALDLKIPQSVLLRVDRMIE